MKDLFVSGREQHRNHCHTIIIILGFKIAVILHWLITVKETVMDRVRNALHATQSHMESVHSYKIHWQHSCKPLKTVMKVHGSKIYWLDKAPIHDEPNNQ